MVKRARGRPPWKAPEEKRQKVVAVRFSDDEWQGLKSEANWGARKRLTASDVIRNALAFYLSRQDVKQDPQPPSRRDGEPGRAAVNATVQVESERATITFHQQLVWSEEDAWRELLEAVTSEGPAAALEALDLIAEQEYLELAAEQEEPQPRGRSKRN
jgi:hypothetical protein